MGKSGSTTFTIFDEKTFQSAKFLASQQGKKIGQFMWDCLEEKTNKLSKKHSSLHPFLEGAGLPKPPTNVFDLKGWEDWINSLDKDKWKKLDKLASSLIDLSNNKRAELKKVGKL